MRLPCSGGKRCLFKKKLCVIIRDEFSYRRVGCKFPEKTKSKKGEKEAFMPNRNITLDVSKIKMAIRAGIPLSITTYTLPRDMVEYMEAVLSAFLKELNQSSMNEYLRYCLNELVTNSKKANTKRIYFKEKGLDITDDAQYEKGMKNFKQDTLGDIKRYMNMQRAAGLYVKFILQTRNNKIKLEVRNNSEMTFREYKRIHDKLSRAQQYTSVDQAMNQILDDSEGAGLGIIIMILMLEKVGLTEENYQVLCENGETITRIILPINEKSQKELSVVSHEFVKLIDNLPQFPENITRINNILDDPNAKMSEIASIISSDVSLATDLLRLVNSAAFALASPCRSISEAVKLVGIHGIKNMLLSIASINELSRLGDGVDEKKSIRKDMWIHSYRVAFYAYNLAKNFYPTSATIAEDSYICGLLHDMGKLIFEAVHPLMNEKMKSVCVKKDISTDVFERLVAGVNHGEIGALIAEKWNFPEVITNVIRFHHDPELAAPEHKATANIIYLADMLAHFQREEVDFYQFDKEVLNSFHITTQSQLKMISEKLASEFAKEPF